MATTGTTAFNMDFTEIAEEAWERAGREMRSGYDLRTARRSMNLMTIEWQNRGINMWTIDEGTVSTALEAGSRLAQFAHSSGLWQAWAMKPLLSGKELMKLGAPGGSGIAQYIDAMLHWQLLHPSASVEEALVMAQGLIQEKAAGEAAEEQTAIGGTQYTQINLAWLAELCSGIQVAIAPVGPFTWIGPAKIDLL